MARYAMIGTRSPSDKMFERIHNVARFLVRRGHHIHTGGAKGVDEAAMVGAASVDASKLHVFLPWADYNKDIIPAGANTYLFDEVACPNWSKSVDKYHPNARALTRGPRALHARNYGIVMFPEPVDAVIAVPKSIQEEGGTGQGMRIAIGENVELYNIIIKDEWLKLKTILDAMK